jgi:hypothetical protein
MPGTRLAVAVGGTTLAVAAGGIARRLGTEKRMTVGSRYVTNLVCEVENQAKGKLLTSCEKMECPAI